LYGNNFIHLYQKKNLEFNSRLLLYSFYNIRSVSIFTKKIEVEKKAIPNVLHIHIKFIIGQI